ncbi:MAG: ATP-binding cassette domain-containing protein, partial [Leptospiraceae bacterium]|nr:ATP-binding cassette domain-containing protein [Leptospiraceae bacterium]
MDIIKIENVKKQFKQGENVVEALRGVSFSIQEAEFAALVGPSGSGKTTLLNIIGGLDSLTEGKVEVDSEDL